MRPVEGSGKDTCRIWIWADLAGLAACGVSVDDELSWRRGLEVVWIGLGFGVWQLGVY